jgi:chromosome segregation ATPase
LQEQLDLEKSENQKLAEKLQQQQQVFKETTDSKSELEDQLEKLKLEIGNSQERTRSLDLELDRKNVELEQCRENLRRLEIELENRADELLSMSREIESLRKCLNESERKIAEAEKEVLTTKDRERAQKELNQQMITYHKELQDQIRWVPFKSYCCEKCKNK